MGISERDYQLLWYCFQLLRLLLLLVRLGDLDDRSAGTGDLDLGS